MAMADYNDSHLIDFDRAGKITASLVAAICGVDPYVSRQEAWRRILGTAKEKPSNGFQSWGIEHEQDALAAFEVETGFFVKPGRFVTHPNVPWLGASPDGFTSAGCPVEVKCPNKLHQKIPDHYYLQVLTQMECCEKGIGYFASWTETGFWWTPVDHDKSYWWNEVYPQLFEFYHEYLVKKIEPPRRKRNAAKV